MQTTRLPKRLLLLLVVLITLSFGVVLGIHLSKQRPENMLIDSLHCDREHPRDTQRAYTKLSLSSQDYVFRCLVYHSQWDYAFTEVTIQRFFSQAKAEAAFDMAPGTLDGSWHGYLVKSSTDDASLSWAWYYLGERHIVIYEQYVPMLGFRSMTSVDIGFDLELFATTLNFVRSLVVQPR